MWDPPPLPQTLVPSPSSSSQHALPVLKLTPPRPPPPPTVLLFPGAAGPAHDTRPYFALTASHTRGVLFGPLR